MAQPLTIALPPGLELWGGCAIAVTALDPSTGAPVAGVRVSQVALEVEVRAGGPEDLESGPFLLVTGPQG